MNHDELMSQLRDIHHAPPPAWWPPAMGYYLVVLGVMVLALLVFGFARLQARTRVRKLLLKELAMIERDFVTARDAAQLQASLSALLRRFAFSVNKTLPKASDLEAIIPTLVKARVDKDRVASIISLLKEERYRKEPQIDGALLISLTREQIKRCRI